MPSKGPSLSPRQFPELKQLITNSKKLRHFTCILDGLKTAVDDHRLYWVLSAFRSIDIRQLKQQFDFTGYISIPDGWTGNVLEHENEKNTH